MKDHETLSTHNVKDGLTVHLVIKAPRTPTNQSQDSTSQRSQGIEVYESDSERYLISILSLSLLL